MAQEVVTSPLAELVFISLYAGGALCVMLALSVVTFLLSAPLQYVKLLQILEFAAKTRSVVTGRLSHRCNGPVLHKRLSCCGWVPRCIAGSPCRCSY